MNIQEKDILLGLLRSAYISQRTLSQSTGHSLGAVNKAIAGLLASGYINEKNEPTIKVSSLIKKYSPRRAIILAAGFGLRMIPLNSEYPKGLLEINKEPLIERTINQLHAAGIDDIYVVVGFMKERYEYLIDDYNIRLIVNPEYSRKNNLHSLLQAVDHIDNTYIIPCDIWCRENPYSKYELYSWYMITDNISPSSHLHINRKKELVEEKQPGCDMVGIAYICGSDSQRLKEGLASFAGNTSHDSSFWEEALFADKRAKIYAKKVKRENVYEINTYEQLREIDEGSDQLKSKAIIFICNVLNVKASQINNITSLKKGMTNRSFLFECGGARYIMRIPGEGTASLINRRNEADVYRAIMGLDICDDIIYIDPNSGYKITRYIEGAHVLDADNHDELRQCIAFLRKFHDMKIKVEHSFDLTERIIFYESLKNGIPSLYKDYDRTKENVLSLEAFVKNNISDICLSHIDAVPDNFLICEENESRRICLIDWEYAGMADPHIDIAMFSIYAFLEKEEIDNLIDIYFEGNVSLKIRIKIYCYVAMCGLLWSNWCEYKNTLGIDFGEYSLRQYRYAKDFYKIALNEAKKADIRLF